jgi:hypothetical protein
MEFEASLIPYLTTNHADLLVTIKKEGVISDTTNEKMHEDS